MNYLTFTKSGSLLFICGLLLFFVIIFFNGSLYFISETFLINLGFECKLHFLNFFNRFLIKFFGLLLGDFKTFNCITYFFLYLSFNCNDFLEL